MAESWRIVKTRHAASAFDGEGARLFGGRWTSRGRRAVYTSATAALATLEIIAHLESPAPLGAYSLVRVTFEDRLIEPLDPDRLPEDWRSYPAPLALQEIGNEWLDAERSPVLRVPSAIVPMEFNYLLNRAHRRFGELQIDPPRPHDLDSRLT